MTPTRLPESKLAEIAEREGKATPGLWRVCEEDVSPPDGGSNDDSSV